MAKDDTVKQTYYEDHPSRHDYARNFRDFVLERNRAKVPTVIKRYCICPYCPVERVDFINVIQWELVGRYYRRPKGTVIVRRSRKEVMKEHMLQTLTVTPGGLSADDIELINRGVQNRTKVVVPESLKKTKKLTVKAGPPLINFKDPGA